MLLSTCTVRRAVAGAIAAGPIGCDAAWLRAIRGWSASYAGAPAPPGCSAADLARVSSGVASATSDYLYSHPDVNNFFTSLHGLPNDEIPNDVRNWTIVTIPASGTARADVCVSAGRRVSVSGCANVADAVAPYVPPPAYYAPLPDDPPPPPNITGCVSYNGRWVNAGGCNNPNADWPDEDRRIPKN